MLLSLVGLLIGVCVCSPKPTLLASWSQLNFSFPDSATYQAWVASNGPAACMPAGVKVYPRTGAIFVSVPRWQAGVPATLNVLQANVTDSPLLIPYPSWELNEVGNPAALQSVLGFEIYNDLLYVLDQGSVAGQPAIPKSIKLVGIDLRKNRFVFTLPFDQATAPLATSFLNDLVLDVWHDFIYITDSGSPFNQPPTSLSTQGALIVVDIKSGSARRLLNTSASTASDPEFWLTIQGERVTHAAPMRTGSDGIALLPGGQTLLWTPLSSTSVYAIDAAFLRDPTIPPSEVEAAVVFAGSKRYASDGMVFDNEGSLYAGALEMSGVMNVSVDWAVDGVVVGVEVMASDQTKMMWPDTLGFDGRGNLVFTSNQLQKFVQGEVVFNATTPNFRIWAIQTNTTAYYDGGYVY